MKNILPQSTNVFQKIILKTYYSIVCHKLAAKYKFQLHVLTLFIKQLQLASILLSQLKSVQYYSESSILVKTLSVSRFDLLMAKNDQIKSFMTVCLIFIFTNVMIKFIISSQLIMKKRFCFKAFILLSNLGDWLMFTFLLIPYTLFTFDCVQGYFTQYSVVYSGYSPFNEVLYAPFIVIGFLCMVLDTLLNTLFGNIPKFSKRNPSRVFSLVHIQELLCIFAIGLFLSFFNSQYSTYIYLVISGYNLYAYYYYLPYTCMIFNKANTIIWSSVLAGNILSIVSKVMNDYYIFEVNFVILYIFLVLINIESLNKRIEKIQQQEAKNPYDHELKLRVSILNTSEQDITQTIFDHFKEANEKFPSFTIQYIWESILIKKYLKDTNLSLMKVVKVNTYKFKNISTITYTGEKMLTYPYRLETDFLLYAVFQKTNKSKKDINKDLALIKNFSFYNKIRELDEDILKFLLEFILCLEGDSNSKVIKKGIEKIGSFIKTYRQLSKKMIRKFGIDKKLAKLYGGFLHNILKCDEGLHILASFGLDNNSDQKIFGDDSEFDKANPTLVISGWYKNIGTVLYANSSIYSLLKINNESSLIGTSFTKLIPRPFDTIHDHVLYRYLFNRNSTELTRGHLFLLDSNGNCIEVTMHFKLSFYHCNPYFIANFKVINSNKSMILCSYEGQIYSHSEKFKDLLPEGESNLFLLMPGLNECLSICEWGNSFEFQAFERNFYIKKMRLEIDGYKMMVLYFGDKEMLERRKSRLYLKKNVQIQDEEVTKIEKHQTGINDSEMKKQFGMNDNAFEDRININSSRRIGKFLNLSIKVLLFTEFAISFSILIVILQIIQELSVNSIISDIGMMRYLSTSILANTQSVDFLYQGYPVAYTEDYYKSSIQTNANKLKSLIEQYRSINLPFLSEKIQYFSNEYIKMFSFTDDIYSEEYMTVLDSIQIIITKANLVVHIDSSTYTSNNTEILEIYRNVPSNYLKGLQSTIMKIIKDLLDSLGKVFRYMEYLELICIIPPVVLILISAFLLYKVEKSNAMFWNLLLRVSKADMIETQTNIIDRLYFVHEFEYINENPISKNSKNLKHSMVIIPLIKIFGLVVIVISFYLSLTFGPQATLSQMLYSGLNHTNYGGMRRMLTPLTLYWSRESLLEASNHTSYIQKIPYYEISSSYEELENTIDMLLTIQKNLMKTLNHLADKRYNYDPYINLMLGNACEVIDNIENCSQTLVSKGIDSGMKEYLQTLQTQYRISKGSLRSESLLRIENYSKNVEKSFVFGLTVYENYTNEVLTQLKTDMVLTTVGFIILNIIYFFLFLNNLATKIVKELENKDEILRVFYLKKNLITQKSTKNSTFSKKSSSIK